MNRYFQQWRQRPFVRNVMTLTTGTTIAQAIPALIAPVLTRLYTPDEFGLLALFISISALFSVIATGKYELAIVLPTQDPVARKLVYLSLKLVGYTAAGMLLVSILFHDPVVALLNNPGLNLWLYFVPLAVLFSATYEVFRHYCIRKKAYRNISTSSVMRTGTASTLQVLTGFLGWGAKGLIIGYLVSLFSGNLKVWNVFRRHKKGNVPFTGLSAVAGRYKNFPKYTLPSLFLNTASTQLPIFLFATFFSSAVVGFFALTLRVLRTPLVVIGNSIGQVYFQKASECRGNPRILKQLTWRLYKSLLWIGVVPLGILLCFGTELFGLVFGAEWATAGDYAKVLGVWFFMVFISSPLSNLFFVQERQKEGFKFQLLLFISRLLALTACIALHFDAFLTILIFGLCGAVLFLGFVLYLLALVGIPKWRVLCYTFAAMGIGFIPFYVLKLFL